ncbi:MAG: MMPL family transporter [Planctomycetaceae bacterium]
MSESDSNAAHSDQPSRWTVRRSLWGLGVMALALPFMAWQLGGLRVSNDVETWLPADDPHSQVLQWFQSLFGEQSGVLASWDGATLNDPRVEAFAAVLAGPPDEEGVRTQQQPYIQDVHTPKDLIRRMLANDVDRDTAVAQLQGVIIGTGPLKVRLTSSGRRKQNEIVEQIRKRAQDELGIELSFLSPETEQQSDKPVEGPEDLAFQQDEFSGPGVDDPYDISPPHDFQIRWPGMTPTSPAAVKLIDICSSIGQRGNQALVEQAFFIAGNPVAVVITLNEEGEEHVEQAIAAIREAANTAGVPETDLRMGGSPIARSELDRMASGATWNPSYPWWNLPKRSPVLTSAIVGIGLSFLVLQSFRLAILVLITDLYVALLAVSLLPATGTSLNMVLIVMPNLLIVLTASGAIHIANYWKHAAAERLEGAVSSAVKMGWQPCVLASVTTAIGLTSLLTSVLRPVREFGIFSAIGCLISLAVVLFGFPSMLRLWRGDAPPPEDADHSLWRRLGHWLYQHSSIVMVCCMIFFAVGAYGLRWFRTETKVIRYFKPDASIVQDYNFLEENLAGIAPVDVIVSFDETTRENLTSVERMELIRRLKQKIADYPDISGTLALSDFRPPLETPSDDASFATKARYRRTVHGMDQFLDAARSEEHGGLVTINPTNLNVKFGDREVVMPAGSELWRVQAQVALMTDLDYNVMTEDLNRIISTELNEIPGAKYVVTGMVPLFLRTQNAVVESLIESFALAFTVIALVIMILLRHPIAGFITMLPNLMPVVVVFGLISAAGVPVDIGTMITASVALGIAVDGTLHLLTWFRDGIRRGMTRRDAIALGLAHCGPAMWQTSAAIGLGLAMLAFADLLLISRFGWLMGALIGAALLADIVFLPVLLAGPLGTMIERKVPRQSLAEASTNVGSKMIPERKLSGTRRDEGRNGEVAPHPQPARTKS